MASPAVASADSGASYERAGSTSSPAGLPRPGLAEQGIALNLTEVAIALSDALNLVGIEDAGHGKRVAFMATEVGKAAGLPADALDRLFLSALLHDCGVSSNRVYRKLTTNFDWEGSAEHCLAGHELLFGFPPFRTAASIVLHHHDRWDSPARAQTEPDIALLANAIFLADRTDVLCLAFKQGDILMARGAVRDGIARRSKGHFSPELVGAFLEASIPEAFWLTLEPRHIDRYIEDALLAARPGEADARDLRQLATIFARIVDAKSPFTAQHSLGVARLARVLGGLLGMSTDVCDQLEIAGLLHDLGKLRIPDEVLEKHAPLDAGEFSTISRHGFDTYQILRRIRPFQTLATWASFLHEALSGGGYPFRRRGLQIPFPARALAVADVFQALLQTRPYRPALTPDPALKVLREMSEKGKLDPEIVEVLAQNLDLCRVAAVGEPGSAAASADAGR
jgi:HD-GYP domain-containing protein (c-di-GMP phosphodiesterase class II)